MAKYTFLADGRSNRSHQNTTNERETQTALTAAGAHPSLESIDELRGLSAGHAAGIRGNDHQMATERALNEFHRIVS